MNSSDFITGPPATSTVAEHTLYARDANGEVMAIYKGSNTEANRYNMTCSEWYIYGSKSHGRFARSQEPPYNTTMPVYDPQLLYNAGTPPIHTRRLKYKDYEIKDHLGNVTTLFSDLKLPAGTQGTYFKIDLMEANNFYPFGMSESGLHYKAPSFNYRYSYNGMEKDDAIKGEGNSYDYGARFFDPRLGRFLSLDPFNNNFPSVSPFNYTENNPVWRIDSDGNKWSIANAYVENGVLKIQIVFSAVLIKKNNEYFEIDDLKNSIAEQGKSSFSANFNLSEEEHATLSNDFYYLGDIPYEVEVKTTINVKTVEPTEKLTQGEHVFSIFRPTEEPEKLNSGELAGYLSMNIYLSEARILKIIEGDDCRSVVHGMGHTAGFLHPNKEGSKADNQYFEPYWAKDAVYDNSTHNAMYEYDNLSNRPKDYSEKWYSLFNTPQFVRLINNIIQNKVNKQDKQPIPGAVTGSDNQ
jgi:RHS repeat-associated protein